jgi:hypothetical protein
MWHGEALYGLGVQGDKILILLGPFTCQVWLQHLSKIFDFWHSWFASALLSPSWIPPEPRF